MTSLSTRSVYHEVRSTPTAGVFFTRAFCWSCSQKVDAKGGTRKTYGNLHRFTCAACLVKRKQPVSGD